MKDPSLGNVAPNMKISEDVILSSLSEENPFAEYMWMENEEEFNRQVRTGTENTPVQGHRDRHTVSCRSHLQLLVPSVTEFLLFVDDYVLKSGC